MAAPTYPAVSRQTSRWTVPPQPPAALRPLVAVEDLLARLADAPGVRPAPAERFDARRALPAVSAVRRALQAAWCPLRPRQMSGADRSPLPVTAEQLTAARGVVPLLRDADGDAGVLLDEQARAYCSVAPPAPAATATPPDDRHRLLTDYETALALRAACLDHRAILPRPTPAGVPVPEADRAALPAPALSASRIAAARIDATAVDGHVVEALCAIAGVLTRRGWLAWPVNWPVGDDDLRLEVRGEGRLIVELLLGGLPAAAPPRWLAVRIAADGERAVWSAPGTTTEPDVAAWFVEDLLTLADADLRGRYRRLG